VNFVFREMHHVEILVTSDGLRLGGNSVVNVRGLCVKYTTELLASYIIYWLCKVYRREDKYI